MTTVEAQQNSKVFKDLVYANIGEKNMLLDIYIPQHKTKPYLVVWIHGGAWRAGSKADVPLEFLDAGFAIASVDYRLSTEAPFPALIHDIKASIRFLRANAKQYGFNGKNIAIAGSSAGGHLVALIGVSNGDQYLEGSIGDYQNTSSSVQAIADYYGPTNFNSILKQSTPHGISVRSPALKLLKTHPEDNPEAATLASPVSYIDKSDPPLIILHGDQDPQVPINQSHELHGLYKKHNLNVHFEVLHGSAHGGPAFFNEQNVKLVTDFFKKNLKD